MLDRSHDRQTRCARVGSLVILALIAALALTCSSPAEAGRHHHRRALPPGLTDPAKDAALIVDGETGKVLYARNATVVRHPASLTKMMTLYLLFDALKRGQLTLATPLPISAHAASQKPTNLHLDEGDTISVDAAIKALVVRSANDVAVAIAEKLGGTEAHFAGMMTAKARELGMRDTFFRNASGLPNPMQITTASDLAILARHLAYDFPQYFHYFAAAEFTFRGVTYETHDNLIGRYKGADGIKTGYTQASGFNLVSSVVRNNSHVIGVVMGGRTAHRRDKEMVRLLDETFARINRNPTLVARAPVPWRTVAQNTSPLGVFVATAQTVDLTISPPPVAVRGSVADADDEDAAESRGDEYMTEELFTPAPTPKPPVVVASYRPNDFKPAAPKSALRPAAGEGDIGGAFPLLNGHYWTIQIGAFTDRNMALAQLAAYAEKSMDVLGRAQRIVVPFQSLDGQVLFRARFGPFLEREARQICARLTERGQTCFAAIATR